MYKNYKIIALCIAQINNERNFDFVYALNKAINKFGYKFFIYHSYSDFYIVRQNEDGDKAIYDLIDFNIVDAIIILEESIKKQSISDEIVEKAKANSVPVITVGSTKQSTANFILNYEFGFEQVVRHIISFHKIKDTIMIAGHKDNYYSNKRIEVYKKVLLENNLPFNESMVYYGDFWSGPVREIIQKLIDDNNLPKAILCANDMMAISAIALLQENGYSVPDDIIVTGFDGSEDAKYNIPPITTCGIDHNKLAVDLLLSVDKLLLGQTISTEYFADQIMEIYSSCGCNKTPKTRHGSLLRVIRDRYDRLLGYNAILYEMTERLFALKSSKEIPHIIKQYEIYNSYVLVNNTFFDESVKPAKDNVNKVFSDDMYLLYKPNGVLDDLPLAFKKRNILPDIDNVIEEQDPLIFTAHSSSGVPFGFLCVHFDTDIENFSVIPLFATFLSTALSGYRNIKYLNYISKEHEKLAMIDSMTGLLNRSGFYKEIEKLKNQMDTKSSYKLIVAIADLDGLKKINDNYGHLAGDHAIMTLANIIKTIPIENKISVRFGGDEFLICAVCKNEASVRKIIKNHISEYIKHINKTSNTPYKLSVSIGFSSSNDNKIDINHLLMKSDELMYNHKLRKKYKHL